jgi:hypothetical protein
MRDGGEAGEKEEAFPGLVGGKPGKKQAKGSVSVTIKHHEKYLDMQLRVCDTGPSLCRAL